MRNTFTFFLFIIAFTVHGQIPAGYYDSADGLTGYTLKTALKNIIDGHTSVGYANVNNYFDDTDTDGVYENDGTVLDMYSENPTGTDAYNFDFNAADQCGNYTAEGDCYNPEHLFPQGFYNEQEPMRSDLHQLIPTDGFLNNARGNIPFGETNSGTTYSNGTKRGSSATPGFFNTVFEPIDEFKGDFARMLLYFATRYESDVTNASWDAHDADVSNPLNGTNDQVFEDWFVNLLLSWHAADPVSTKEINRNNAIYIIQGNRNPYIDHPEYVTDIWQAIPDTQSPSVPTNLNITNVASTSMNLSWNASTDNYGVTEYVITMDGSTMFTTSNTNYAVTGLTPETQYCFTVKAKDAAGNESAESTEQCATTTAGSSGGNLLFFTEYVEGTSVNKALEIGNFTGQSVDLSEYSIKKQVNGGGAWVNELVLSGSLADGQVYVLANSGATTAITDVADFTTGAPIDFSGNDPIGLFHNGDLIDIIGDFDGGSADFAKNVTIRRKSSVTAPNTTFDLPGEWDSFATDTFDGLGNHTLSIDEFQLEKQWIQIVPNPAKDDVLIQANNKIDQLEIYSVDGKLIYQSKPQMNEVKLNVSGWKSGVYMVVLVSDGQKVVEKLVKR